MAAESRPPLLTVVLSLKIAWCVLELIEALLTRSATTGGLVRVAGSTLGIVLCVAMLRGQAAAARIYMYSMPVVIAATLAFRARAFAAAHALEMAVVLLVLNAPAVKAYFAGENRAVRKTVVTTQGRPLATSAAAYASFFVGAFLLWALVSGFERLRLSHYAERDTYDGFLWTILDDALVGVAFVGASISAYVGWKGARRLMAALAFATPFLIVRGMPGTEAMLALILVAAVGSAVLMHTRDARAYAEGRDEPVPPRKKAPPVVAGVPTESRPVSTEGAAALKISAVPVPERPIAARFHDLSLIGEGASSKVYRAVETRTGAVVALKIMSPHLDFDAVSLERFKREIQIARALGQPQVVSMYDVGRDGPSLYIVMELIEGTTLTEHIQTHGPMPEARALEVLRDLLSVLAACHRKGVVHRDVKPQNLMVMPDGRLKLLDFGVARMTTLSDLTQAGASLGTPEYMAPELFAANVYDPRTDIYAAGIVLYEMLAGKPPFQADTLAEIFRAHASTPPPDLRKTRPQLSEWVADLASRMLAKRSFERYQVAEEVLEDIAARRVALKGAPRLPRRTCLDCHEKTLAEVPLCVMCGRAVAPSVGEDETRVFLPASAAWPDVRRLIADAFGLEAPRSPPGETLLVEGLDGMAAAGLKTLAQRYGLFLTVKPKPRQRTALEFLTGVAMVAVPCGAVAFAYGLVSEYFKQLLESERDQALGSMLGNLFVFFGVSAIPAYGAWLLFKSQRRVAIVPRSRLEEARSREAQAWLRELAPHLAAARTEGMKAMVAHLVERYVLIAKSLRESLDGVEPLARRILVISARIAPVVSQLEVLMRAPHLRELCERHSSAPDGATASALEKHARLEDRLVSLQGRLIHLQAVFDGVLGKALLGGGALNEGDIERFAARVRDLDLDATAANAAAVEVRAALEEAA